MHSGVIILECKLKNGLYHLNSEYVEQLTSDEDSDTAEEMPAEEYAVTTKTYGLKCIGALDRLTLAPQTVIGLADISSPAPGIDVELIGRGGNRIAGDKGSDFLSGVPLALPSLQLRVKNREDNRIARGKGCDIYPSPSSLFI